MNTDSVIDFEWCLHCRHSFSFPAEKYCLPACSDGAMFLSPGSWVVFVCGILCASVIGMVCSVKPYCYREEPEIAVHSLYPPVLASENAASLPSGYSCWISEWWAPMHHFPWLVLVLWVPFIVLLLVEQQEGSQTCN